MTTPTKRKAAARLVDGSNGKLLFGDDPRLAHQNKTGSTGTTAEPVVDTNTNPQSNGAKEHGPVV